MGNTISQRGVAATQTELRSDFKIFFEAKDDLFDSVNNPEGKFPLNMAENNLSWKDMKAKLEGVLSSRAIPAWVPSYTNLSGNSEFLLSLSSFMARHLTNCPIDPNRIIASAGATAVLEVTSWVLCDAGDVAVIPAPSYPVYTQDIKNKSAVERYDLVTHHSLDNMQSGSLLSIDHLKRAKIEIEKSGKEFKLLMITTPDNPTGVVYTQNQLSTISEWCTRHRIHLLVNELYGLSTIDTTHPSIIDDYDSHHSFVSFANIIGEQESDYLHLCYGLSKDLGISGFRVGVIYSMNEAFLTAYNNLNAPHLVSNLTQWVMTDILSDQFFMDQYIKSNQERLTENYAIVIQCLKKLNIPYVPAKGSLFVWLDLSDLLSESNQYSDHVLWEQLYKDTGILLTPGQGFGHSKKGQYRLVYSFLEPDVLLAAMDSFSKYILSKIHSKSSS